MPELIHAGLVSLDADLGRGRQDVIRAMARLVAAAGRANDADRLVADTFDREATAPTGLPGGIAIPHCRTSGVDEPVLAFARLDPPADFGAEDGPADLVLLIAGPAGADTTHLQLLMKLARALIKPAFTDALREAETPQRVVELVSDIVGAPWSTPPTA